ncbi:hypothetical protein [Kitasatospora brasiliensis]|uniref:hypothetical protein n=1 Tax=Kitasatospora brasiliensis TaxID=3058040 RepID=UPI00293161B9|nr:hypothetical protein [Kitasatospora sp. K002]
MPPRARAVPVRARGVLGLAVPPSPRARPWRGDRDDAAEAVDALLGRRLHGKAVLTIGSIGS